MAHNIRVYPTCCTSMYCGETSESCPTCKCYPQLKAFKDWVQANNAQPSDPIWSPNVYVAQPA